MRKSGARKNWPSANAADATSAAFGLLMSAKAVELQKGACLQTTLTGRERDGCSSNPGSSLKTAYSKTAIHIGYYQF